MIGRREVLAASGVAFLAAAGTARACTFTPDPRLPFSDRECLRGLRQWVSLLNAAPSLPMEQLRQQVDELSVEVEGDELLYNVLQERMRDPEHRAYSFYKEFRLSGGRLDPQPIQLAETHRIRRLRNRATYQFTLQRLRFAPEVTEEEAANDSCGFASPARYWIDRTSYLATFWNNRLQSVKLFPEWYLEEAA